jgi:precorrin-6Y C5,15-methyltransferase (decarboxylating)
MMIPSKTDPKGRPGAEKVHIVGLGLDYGDLSQTIRETIARAEILVGGERQLEAFRDHPAHKITVKAPLDRVIEEVSQARQGKRAVVVLADGDPGFFGIGKRLVTALGSEQVEIYPNLTILQAAAARIKIPWEEIITVSLHGRKHLSPLLQALTRNDWVGVFTDREWHPGRIAETLIERQVDTFRMHIFEDLWRENEKTNTFELNEARGRSFPELNFVLLERTGAAEIRHGLGLADESFLHGQGLITKREIRAVGLAMLRIEPGDTVWDLGAGCGSVAIEAAFLASRGRVLAVEKEASRVRLIQSNIRRTGAYGVEVIHGEMPRCLDGLPEPDRIFLGGGVGGDPDVLTASFRRLKAGGHMVLHAVLLGTLEKARAFLDRHQTPYHFVQVQISRSRELAGDERLEALNPVYIVGSQKPFKG